MQNSKLIIVELRPPARSKAFPVIYETYSRIFLKLLVLLARRRGFRLSKLSEAVQLDAFRMSFVVDIKRLPYLYKYLDILEKNHIPGTLFAYSSQVTRDKKNREFISPHLFIHYLLQKGWELGSKGHNRTLLSSQPRRYQVSQIESSIKGFQGEFDLVPKVFKYPSGDFDAESVMLLRRKGFLGALGNKIGDNQGKVNRYHLKLFPLDSLAAWIKIFWKIYFISQRRPYRRIKPLRQHLSK